MTMVGHNDEVARERVRYFPRQLVGAADLNADQAYHRQRLREHNRYLHGWGVVCGCDVRPAASSEKPWQVRICPGYLVTPHGDAIDIRQEVLFDVASCLLQSEDPCAVSRPCPPVRWREPDRRMIYLAVRFVECESRPVRVAPSGCSCDDTECEYSRIRDGYEFCCLDELPEDHLGGGERVSKAGIAACPSCEGHGWVVLATITLPISRATELTAVDPLRNRRSLRPQSSELPGSFTALDPARILDTRVGVGAPAARILPQATLELNVTGVGGVPAGGVSAVALNVTVVLPAAVGHLVVYPTGMARPDTSTHNFVTSTVANLVLAKVGTGGSLSMYNGGGELDLVSDVEGWFRL